MVNGPTRRRRRRKGPRVVRGPGPPRRVGRVRVGDGGRDVGAARVAAESPDSHDDETTQKDDRCVGDHTHSDRSPKSDGHGTPHVRRSTEDTTRDRRELGDEMCTSLLLKAARHASQDGPQPLRRRRRQRRCRHGRHRVRVDPWARRPVVTIGSAPGSLRL